MIGEIQLLDIYAPSALVWAMAAGVLMIAVKAVLRWLGLYRWVWYPGLFDLALYCCLWTGIGYAVQFIFEPFAFSK